MVGIQYHRSVCRKVFFGDYLNISSVNGIIMPIWPRMDQRKISLWVAPINKSLLK